MVSWQAFPSLLPSLRAPRVSLVFPSCPKPPFLSFSNARHAGYWQANILPNEAKYTLPFKFLIYQLICRMWRSMFVTETIFRRSVSVWSRHIKRFWTIWSHSRKLKWARRRTFHQLHSLSLGSSHEKFDRFGIGLTLIQSFRNQIISYGATQPWEKFGDQQAIQTLVVSHDVSFTSAVPRHSELLLSL